MKGQSGNPGGRPKVVGEVRELARERTEEAINTLTVIMGDTDAPPAARVSAANAILDRGHGKPTQAMALKHSTIDPVQELLNYVASTPRPGVKT